MWRDAPGDCRKGLAGWTDQGGLYFYQCTQVEGRLGVAAVVLFVVQEMVFVCVCVRACACVHLHACVCTACAGVNRSHGDVAVVSSQLAYQFDPISFQLI